VEDWIDKTKVRYVKNSFGDVTQIRVLPLDSQLGDPLVTMEFSYKKSNVEISHKEKGEIVNLLDMKFISEK